MSKKNWLTDDTNLDVLWMILKTTLAFMLIRMLCMNIRFFRGLFADAIQVLLFTYIIYQYVKAASTKSNLSLEECYIGKVRFGIKDILVASFIIILFDLGISLLSERIVPTNVEKDSFWGISISNFLRSGLASGVNEELVFRGYLLKQIEEKKGRKWAAILSSLVFGLGHTLNGGMTPVEILWIAIGTASVGMMFCILTYETGTIWRGVILHIFMNTKERILGFNPESSLYMFEFPSHMSQEEIFCTTWMVMCVVSWSVVIWYWWKKKQNG